MTALVLVVVASPALRDRDSFPLSTHPMYASTRAEVAAFSTVTAAGADGQRVRLSMRTIARTDDALIAQARVRQAIAGGRADELCADVASRAPEVVESIEVVTERHDVVDLATGQPSLVSREVHATCEAAT